ncbi:uncharacterized, partial [Tachysurus ichikawai]
KWAESDSSFVSGLILYISEVILRSSNGFLHISH